MVSTSYATADRVRRKVVGEIETKVRDNRTPPKLCTLHLDSNLTLTPKNHRVTEERMTVIVSNSTQMKLLGVPSYTKATDKSCGSISADLTMKLTDEWRCSHRIVIMTFDTTSSNTGYLSAACIAIQNKLDRPILWSGCRHHIGEVILSYVFEDLKIEASKSPDVTLFTRFRSNWGLVPHSSSLKVPFSPSDHPPEAQELLAAMKSEFIARAKETVVFVREDYHEFIQLALVYLGFDEGDDREIISFRRPGALHKARWMAKIIYSLKIVLCEKKIGELQAGTMTTRQQMPKIRAFATFVTHVYGIWWLTCTKTVDAPWNDLQLFKCLVQYEKVHECIAKSAIRAVNRHLWYLTEEMVPLRLSFSMHPSRERKALADALLIVKPYTNLHAPLNRFGAGWGKPKFPSFVINATTRLCDFVGKDSWFTIYRLLLDISFVSLPFTEWRSNEAYTACLVNVGAVNVINDGAERGVKLSYDFVDTARDDKHFQTVLQVVEQDRKAAPNLRRKRSTVNIDHNME